MRNRLTIGDRSFSIRDKHVVFENGHLSLRLDCEGLSFEGEEWAPSLRCDNMIVKADRGIGIRVFEIPDPYNFSDDSYNLTLYVFEHGLTYENRIEIKMSPGEGQRMTIHGLADIHWDEEFGEKVPYSVDVDLDWDGARVD